MKASPIIRSSIMSRTSSDREPVARSTRETWRSRWLGGGLILAAAVGLLWWGAAHWSFEDVARHESHWRAAIDEHPVPVWLVAFAIYFALSLVPGTRGKAVACGWLFGFWPALVMVNGALTLAALCGFAISRRFLREGVASRYPLRLEHVNRELAARGAYYVLGLRLVPVSFTLTNYVLGATRVNGRTYWWATQLGLLPGNLVFVHAGASLPDLGLIVREGWSVCWNWQLVAALAGLSLFTLAVPAVARWLASRARTSQAQTSRAKDNHSCDGQDS